jgi:hypothetical protein
MRIDRKRLEQSIEELGTIGETPGAASPASPSPTRTSAGATSWSAGCGRRGCA